MAASDCWFGNDLSILVSDIRPMPIFPFIDSSIAINLFPQEFSVSWPIITFLGFYNLCACTNGKVLKFQFKSLVIWLTKDLSVLILEETGSKFLIIFIWWL